MQKLRGSGNTFSTSGRPWLPFRMNPKVGRQNAKRHRWMQKGLTGPMSKEQLQELADQAVAGNLPRKS
jgi:hypothetical protein